jgi:hypothetical protein
MLTGYQKHYCERILRNTNALLSEILCGSGTALIYHNPALLDGTHFDSDRDANKTEEVVMPEPFVRGPRTFWLQ